MVPAHLHRDSPSRYLAYQVKRSGRRELCTLSSAQPLVTNCCHITITYTHDIFIYYLFMNSQLKKMTIKYMWHGIKGQEATVCELRDSGW